MNKNVPAGRGIAVADMKRILADIPDDHFLRPTLTFGILVFPPKGDSLGYIDEGQFIRWESSLPEPKQTEPPPEAPQTAQEAAPEQATGPQSSEETPVTEDQQCGDGSSGG